MTKVIYYTNIAEKSPVDEFLDSLTGQQQRKISRVISFIEIYGLTTAIPHIKKLTGTPLWEIRILGRDNIRIFYATLISDSILLLHGFIKKSQSTPDKEINTALNRLNEWINRKTKG
ncbi:type II toxin-antitoxin system RelE/ParE family toxin [Candidatus Daviesbacteria bacterium]|nr:type II toxin-antitoxin system RelE/ParE family toxin [Candidatus Daviesbacteria bacterium]